MKNIFNKKRKESQKIKILVSLPPLHTLRDSESLFNGEMMLAFLGPFNAEKNCTGR